MKVEDGLILVTGAAGFIGSNIACELARAGRQVALCDTFENDDSWRYLADQTFCDVVKPEEVLRWLRARGEDVSEIVHMGAISSTTETDLSKIVERNIRPSIDLWEFASERQVGFIYASSAATYGDGENGFEDDDSLAALSRLRPLNAYAWSKHFVDRRIVCDVERGRHIPARWAGLKFFNVYGPNEGHKGPMRSVVHQIYPRVKAGKPVQLFKSGNPNYRDGGQLRDFVYVKDCVSVVLAMIDSDVLSGIFNVGTGKARTFEDLAKSVFAAVGREPNIEYVDMPFELRGRYQYFTESNVRKLVEQRLAPRFYSLESGIDDYVKEYLRWELE